MVWRARALDLGAHLVQAACDIGDFRLAGRIFENRLALRQGGGHHDIMRCADRNLGEGDDAAAQAARRFRHHIAAIETDLGAERLKAHQMQIHGPGSDGASAGKRDARLVLRAPAAAQAPRSSRACGAPCRKARSCPRYRARSDAACRPDARSTFARLPSTAVSTP